MDDATLHILESKRHARLVLIQHSLHVIHIEPCPLQANQPSILSSRLAVLDALPHRPKNPNPFPSVFTFTTSLNVKLILVPRELLPCSKSSFLSIKSQFAISPSRSSTLTPAIPCNHPPYISPVVISKLLLSCNTRHLGSCDSPLAYTSNTPGEPSDIVATTG